MPKDDPKYYDPEVAYEIDEDELYNFVIDSVVPACCTEGCQVEPDGYCKHGCPSILIELGMI